MLEGVVCVSCAVNPGGLYEFWGAQNNQQFPDVEHFDTTSRGHIVARISAPITRVTARIIELLQHVQAFQGNNWRPVHDVCRH